MKPFDLEKAKAGAPEDAVCVIKTNDGNKYFLARMIVKHSVFIFALLVSLKFPCTVNNV